jgi:hypothetical protein
MNAMDQTIAGAFLERAQFASPKGSLSQAKGQRSNINFHHESYTTRMLNLFLTTELSNMVIVILTFTRLVSLLVSFYFPVTASTHLMGE